MTTLSIDLTSDTTIAAAVTAMDPDVRQKLADALAAAATPASNQAAILDEIRRTLRRKYSHAYDNGHVIGVRFVSQDWDDGRYLDANGVVLFANGNTTTLDFNVAAELTDEYGHVGPGHALTVDLRTGAFSSDEYAAEDSLHAALGIDEPAEPLDPADADRIGELLHGDPYTGLGDRTLRRIAEIAAAGTPHRIAVLAPGAPGTASLVCLTCDRVGTHPANNSPQADISHTDLDLWHRLT